jgi:hypothetical protein
VERELWIRSGMVLSVLGLVALILVTPTLMGRPPPGLDSVPLLVIGMPQNESWFIVNVGAPIQPYRYELIRLSIYGAGPGVNRTLSETETYTLHTLVPTQVPTDGNVTVHAYLIDQHANYFEYNVTVFAEKAVDGRTEMVISFPYEKDNPNTYTRIPPDQDFRWALPWRGTNP